ncbi:MAG: MoaD family protein [Acidimicrobiales bacterium]
MSRLRLFGPAGDAAGVRCDEIAAGTVGALLAVARSRYGTAFTEVLSRSRVWVNGRNADDRTPVGDTDEVAVLPPVSGG